jgi:hypothetical protein
VREDKVLDHSALERTRVYIERRGIAEEAEPLHATDVERALVDVMEVAQADVERQRRGVQSANAYGAISRIDLRGLETIFVRRTKANILPS